MEDMISLPAGHQIQVKGKNILGSGWISKQIVNKKRGKQLAFLLGDIFLISFALFLTYLIRFDWDIPRQYLDYYVFTTLIFVFCLVVSYKIFGLYNSLWKYAGVDELVSIILAVTMGIALSGLAIFLLVLSVPRSILLMMWFINIIFTGGFRLGFRVVRRLYNPRITAEQKRILIIGAGQAGSMVLKELKENKDKINYLPIGFIDDNPEKAKMKIHGLPVLGSVVDARRVIKDYSIEEVIIAMPSAHRKVIKNIVEICKKTKIKAKIMPGVYELLNGSMELKNIRDVDIEDLLGREPVKVSMEEISGYLNGETVLVTGAGGSIGAELCRQISRFNPEELLLLGRGENSIFEIDMELNTVKHNFKLQPIIRDVKDKEGLEKVFKLYNPTVVFHAAAHKHVPLMEANLEEAVKNNVLGTKNIVELSDKYKVKRFVLISTDKAVKPSSVMGITKRIAEMIVQTAARSSSIKFCAVRFGNVLGSRGSVIPIFKKQIARGGPVTVTHPDMTRYFMTITEAVQLVIQAGAMGDRGEIFVLDMGEPVKILEMAEYLIKLSGFEPYQDIKIEFTGVRPGEKLFEELLTTSERVTATRHKKIFIAEADEVNLQKFRKDYIFKLNNLTEETASLKEKLAQMVMVGKD